MKATCHDTCPQALMALRWTSQRCGDGSSSIKVAVITRTFLDRPQLTMLMREVVVEPYDPEYVAPTNDELMASFAIDSRYAAAESTGIHHWERAPWFADFKTVRLWPRRDMDLESSPTRLLRNEVLRANLLTREPSTISLGYSNADHITQHLVSIP